MSSSPPRKRPKLALDYEESSCRDEKAKATHELNSGAPSPIEVNPEEVVPSTPEYSLSPFERLPLDPFARIVNYAPCSVFNLMLASRSLRCLMSEYALMRDSSQLITKLQIQVDPKQQIEVAINVSKSRMKLAELRLTSIKANVSKSVHGLATYKWSVNIDDSADWLELLRGCLGCRIGELHVVANSSDWMTPVTKLANGVRFTALTFEVEVLEESSCPHIINLVKTFKIEQLSIIVLKSALIVSAPEKFLLELSLLARSIYIHHRSAAEHSLFGIHRASWVRVILDMLSRKLDKLWIDNNPYSNDSVNHVTALCQQLPLMRKRIWLEAGCHNHLPVYHPQMQRTMNGDGAAGERRSMQLEQLDGNQRLFIEARSLGNYILITQALDQSILATYFRLGK